MNQHLGPRGATRWIVAALLLATGAIHIALVPQHLHEAPYAAALFIALSVGAVVTAAVLVLAPHRLAWLSAGALACAAAGAYVTSRSIALPALEDDVGDWLNPLGVSALLIETVTILLCAGAGRRAAVRTAIAVPAA